MSKVSVISAYTPTCENRRGISALIYHLTKYRPSDIQMQFFSFNLNKLTFEEIAEISVELGVNIIVLPLPLKYKLVANNRFFSLGYSFLGKFSIENLLIPPKEILHSIMKYDPNFVWIYPNFSFLTAQRLKNLKFVITGPDCFSQVRTRFAADSFFIHAFKRDIHNFFIKRKNVSAEYAMANNSNIQMHFVGMEDLFFYEKVNRKDNAFFLLHPHYMLTEKRISFSKKRIRVLIAGKNDLYLYTDLHFMIKGLLEKKELIDAIEITFLGQNWEEAAKKLSTHGYICNHIKWVDNYINEIVKYDIQISPISMGSGTKGKVLDALVNGLLVIGSKFAFENITVRHMESCVLYRHPKDIAELLLAVFRQKKRFEKIAEEGRTQTRIYHNPERIAQRFFEISLNK